MSIKVLMVADEPYRFGNGAHIAELADAVKKHGHEVVIACGGGAISDEADKLGIANLYIPFRGTFSKFRSYSLLKKIIRDYKPDIVHAHGLAPTALCAHLRGKKSFPLVSSVYDAEDAPALKKLYDKKKPGFLALSEGLYNALYRTGIRGADIEKTVKGIKTDVAPYIPNENEPIRPLAIDENAPVILHRAKLDEDSADTAKLLLGCIDKLDTAFPGVQLVILGEGSCFNLLSNAANDINRNMGRKCVFMVRNRPDIHNIVSKCDIFIGSSRMVLEALALDKPVILSDNDGFGGLFTYEKLEECIAGGFTCAGHDKVTEKDLLTAIAIVLKSKQQSRERLGEYGKSVIEEFYSVTITANAALHAYRNAQPDDRKIVFSGYYGFDNSGDEAILDVTIHAIRDAYPHTEITVLSNDPFRTEKQYGCRAVKRFNPFAVLAAIRRCDILVSGGSLFQDTTSTRSLLYYASVIYIAKLMKKKIMIYANGIGPVIGDRNRKITAAAVSAATTVTLRDDESLEDLRDMGVMRTDMRVTADPIFLIDPAPDTRINEIFANHGVPVDRKILLVSPRPWENAPSFNSKTAKLLDGLIEKYGCSVVFLPIQLPYDVNASENIAALMTNKVHIIDKIYQAEDIAGIVGRAEAVIGMRLPPLVYAARMGVPFAGVDNDPMSKTQLEAFEMYDLGSPEQFDYMNALNLMSAILDNRELFSRRIRSEITGLLGLARINTTEVNRLIESVPKKNKDIE